LLHSQIIPFTDNSPILSISVDQNEEFLFLGNSIGNIGVFKYDKNINDFKLYKIITDHMSAISHIDCNSELNLWASGSIDGYINIYTLPLSKLVRSIKLPTRSLDFVFLSASPLPSIVSIAKENNKNEISLYSINGKLLNRDTEQGVLGNPMVLTNLNSINYLCYVLNSSIVIRRLSSNLMRRVLIDKVPYLYAFCLSEDMKIIYAIDKSGNDIFVIKEESKNTK
jgi:WD40 repeat protein